MSWRCRSARALAIVAVPAAVVVSSWSTGGPAGTRANSVSAAPDDDLRAYASVTILESATSALYRTDDEYAAELSNRTVHAVMHLAWVEQTDGRYQGHMAVYVKPRGRFGTGYMAFIKPFRYCVVYPAVMRQIENAWNTRPSKPSA